MSKSYAALHFHSDKSILDGCCQVSEALDKCKATGISALAVTNHGNMFNIPEALELGVEKGVQVIPGMEAYMTWNGPCTLKDSEHAEKNHLVLLAMNQTGYQNLMKLSTIGYLDGFYYKPRIDYELLRKYNEGLIALSACLAGKVCQTIFKYEQVGVQTELDKVINYFKDVFGDRFYLEVQYHANMPEQAMCNNHILKAGQRTKTRVVATTDSHYLNKEDYEAWKAMMWLATAGAFGGESDNDYWLKTPDEMYALPLPKETIEETLSVAARCEPIILKKQYKFPHIDLKGKTADDDLWDEANKGLIKLKKTSKEYIDRLEYEFSVIKKMDFSSYLLIVADYINWAKSKNIMVGAGRGSAAGSLLCYAIGITDVDPLLYGLLFERFINPERISMPDIDCDFQDDRREEVRTYLINKYGADHVASITTFGTMAARGALRSIARYYGIDYNTGDLLAKAVPEAKRGVNVYLSDAIKDPDFTKLIQSKPEFQKVYNVASRVEGMVKSQGTHAAGVVISDEKPLIEYTPLCLDKEDNIVTQYDMNYLEKIGLIKFDLLGLSTLTTISKTLQFIQDRYGIDIDIINIPTDDKRTFDLICEGNLTGVFQLSGSEGFKELTVKIQPRTIPEIGDITAMYRPGPLDNGFHDMYIKNEGPSITVTNPEKNEQLQTILKPTRNVCLYQEQVMKISQILAGYSLGQADLLRRCIAKGSYLITDQGPELIENFNTPCRYKDYNYEEVWYSGHKMTKRITIQGYPSLYLTNNHTIKTNFGDLQVEDCIGRNDIFIQVDPFPTCGSNTIQEDIIDLGVGVLTEGYLGEKKGCTFVNNNRHLIMIMQNAAERLHIHYKLHQNKKITPFLTFYRNEFLNQIPIKPGLSGDKSLPDAWLKCTPELIKQMIALLFETEGYISSNNKVIGFSSTSEKLFKQVQILLYLLGLRFSVSTKRSKAKSGRSYEIIIQDQRSFNDLLDIIRESKYFSPESKFYNGIYKTHVLNYRCERFPGNIWKEALFAFKDRNNLRWQDMPQNARSGNFISEKSHKTLEKLIRFREWAISKNHNVQDLKCLDITYANILAIAPYKKVDVLDFSESTVHYGNVNGSIVHNCMGKKKPEEMEKMKSSFVEGCVKNNIPKEEGETVFKILEKFAAYGFNVAHSISYSIISYQTAWLKANYPVEFMAAYLTEEMSEADSLTAIINDCLDQGIKVLPPDVNKSEYNFIPEDKAIRFGFGAIKGVGLTAIEPILKARTNKGEFTSLMDFCEKVNNQKVTKKVLELLVTSGSLDSIL